MFEFANYIPQDVETLGKLIKIMRMSRGETQASLAKKLGTCRQHIQKWEYGICRPSPKRLEELMAVLRYKRQVDVIKQYYA